MLRWSVQRADLVAVRSDPPGRTGGGDGISQWHGWEARGGLELLGELASFVRSPLRPGPFKLGEKS